MMLPRLFAFDLDGTLLTDKKQLSPANERALHEMAASGAVVVFASGRLGSSMQRIVPATMDVAMLTLNGAVVYTGNSRGARKVLDVPLSNAIADHLVEYARKKPFALNYYIDDKLYAVRTPAAAPWLRLYYEQTGTEYHFVENLESFHGRRPSKIIFVGDPAMIDEQEKYFRQLWGPSAVYICRTWGYYLEFLDARANKAAGLEALARVYGVEWPQIAAFGDAENDIPMLEKAGFGIAMANAAPQVKLAAGRVSEWTNDEDGVAKEWELMKKKL